MKKLLLPVLLLLSCPVFSQLPGLITDSSYLRLVSSLKVRRVTEFLYKDQTDQFNGLLVYDSLGRLTELTSMGIRSVLYLDSSGRQYGEDIYEKDSVELSRFNRNRLDEHGHILSSYGGTVKNGKADTNFTDWRILRTTKQVCARRWDYPGTEGWPGGYEIEIDSLDGIYKYYITLSYHENDIAPDGEKGFTRKELTREYRHHDTVYYDHIQSKVWPIKEVFEFATTEYRIADKVKRRSEEGYLDYEKLWNHSGTESNNTGTPSPPLPAAFVHAVLSGEWRHKPETVYRTQSVMTYSKDGRQLEFRNGFDRSHFHYNQKQQLSEVEYSGREYSSRTVYTYNTLGLIVTTRIYLAGADEKTPIFEYHYRYSFYSH